MGKVRRRIQHEESSHEKSERQKKWNINAAPKKWKKIKHEENMKSERNSDALEKCKTKKVQNEKSAAQREHEQWKKKNKNVKTTILRRR